MSKRKVTLRGIEAVEKLAKGVHEIAESVVSTLGPRGRNVVIDSLGIPVVTKDGVTVARSVLVNDPGEAVGAKLAISSSVNTNQKVGDGTTTSMLLTDALVRIGLEKIKSLTGLPLDIQQFRSGMQAGLADVVKKIREKSEKPDVEMLKNVATVSANNDRDLGLKVAGIIEKAGINGQVNVEDGDGIEIETEVVEGVVSDQGLMSYHMIDDREMTRSMLEDIDVLVNVSKMEDVTELIEFVERFFNATGGKKKLLVLCDSTNDAVLNTAIVNKIKGSFGCYIARLPGYGERKLEVAMDIAAAIGAKVVGTAELQFKDADAACLGHVKKAICTMEKVTLIGGRKIEGDFELRTKMLKHEISKAKSEYDKERLNERLAKMSGSVAVVKVGAATEAAQRELKYLVEDAINATLAARNGGISPGGGIALLTEHVDRTPLVESTLVSSSYVLGYNSLLQALRVPFQTIVTSSGRANETVMEVIWSLADDSKGIYPGYDAKEDKVVDDMLNAGIVDPTDVVISALTNAVSAALTVLNTGTLAYEEETEPTGK